MKRAMLPVFVCLLGLMTGCAHVYHVRVDAITGGQEIARKTYVIVPGNPNTDAGDLQFREFAMYLSRALKVNGYTAASEKQPPDLEIYLSYGLGTPESRVRSYAVPVWGQTGADITTMQRTADTPDGTTTISSTNITPEYGVTGYATQEENYTVYPKYVEIDAYKIVTTKPGGKLEELWKTTIHSVGKRKDLRHVFPILMAAASKYLGNSTGQEIEITLTENQAEVKRIKGIQEYPQR